MKKMILAVALVCAAAYTNAQAKEIGNISTEQLDKVLSAIAIGDIGRCSLNRGDQTEQNVVYTINRTSDTDVTTALLTLEANKNNVIVKTDDAGNKDFLIIKSDFAMSMDSKGIITSITVGDVSCDKADLTAEPVVQTGYGYNGGYGSPYTYGNGTSNPYGVSGYRFIWVNGQCLDKLNLINGTPIMAPAHLCELNFSKYANSYGTYGSGFAYADGSEYGNGNAYVSGNYYQLIMLEMQTHCDKLNAANEVFYVNFDLQTGVLNCVGQKL